MTRWNLRQVLLFGWHKGLRCRPKEDTLYSNEPRKRKAEVKKRQCRKKFEKNRLQFCIWLENPDTQNFGWSEIAATENMGEKKQNDGAPELFFRFSTKPQMIRFDFWRRQNCDPRRTEKAGSGRTTLRSPGFSENASRKEYFLVVPKQEGLWE